SCQNSRLANGSRSSPSHVYPPDEPMRPHRARRRSGLSTSLPSCLLVFACDNAPHRVASFPEPLDRSMRHASDSVSSTDTSSDHLSFPGDRPTQHESRETPIVPADLPSPLPTLRHRTVDS